jgi:hypothetical protein
MNPQSLALRALAAVGVLMMSFCVGAWWGHEQATLMADADRTRAADKALRQYQRAVNDGQAAAEALREQLRAKGIYQATVEERLRHATLIVPGAAPAKAQCTAAAPAIVTDSAAATPPVAPAPTPGPELDARDVGLQLSLGAVSLWNSALAGADVAAGACGAADPTQPACAAGAGITLAEAWANHAQNAASCAADRTRHQALLDHLNAREGTRQP